MEGRRVPRTFRRQIVITFTTGFLLLSTAAAAAMLYIQKEYLYRANIKQTTALARSLAVSSRSWILANDLVGLQEVIVSLEDYPEISYAMILSPDGRVLGHLNPQNQGMYVSDTTSLSLLKSEGGLQILADTPELLDLAWPVLYESKVISWVRIAVRRDRIYENLTILGIGAAAFVVISALISYTAAVLMAERLSRGISSLSLVAVGVSMGRRDLRAESRQSLELSNLSESFNKMLDDLIKSEESFRLLFEQVPVSLWEEDFSRVTEAMESLRESGIHDFKTYFSENPDFVLSLAGKVSVVRVNHHTLKLFGAGKMSDLTGGLDRIFAPDSFHAFTGALLALAEGRRSYSCEAVNRTLQGDLIQVIITYFIPEKDADGASRMLVAVHNITELKRLESQLRSLNEGLEIRVSEELAANRKKDLLLIQQSRLAAMGEMIHNIAHQWRQPLNSVSLIIQNLQEIFEDGELTNESMDEYTQRILRLLKSMSDTIEEFRNFFRPDKQKEFFRLEESIVSALSLIDAALHSAGIEVIREITDSPEVFGYSNQFSQAVLNILSNAKEAIKLKGNGNGRITISLHQEDSGIILKISDNGGGIPEDVLPRIFDPYFTTKPTGSGIGLYMTRMIVEQNMSGKIFAENIENGACITISLPKSG